MKSKLDKSILVNVEAEGAEFYYASMVGAHLGRGRFMATHFDHADLSAANLFGADLANTYFDGANLTQARLHTAKIYDASFPGARLHGALLERVVNAHRDSFVGAHLDEETQLPEGTDPRNRPSGGANPGSAE